MFIFYYVWALDNLEENNVKLLSLTRNKTFLVIIILSWNYHWVAENVSKNKNGEDKAIKIKKREALYDFPGAYDSWNTFPKYIHNRITTMIKLVVPVIFFH